MATGINLNFWIKETKLIWLVLCGLDEDYYAKLILDHIAQFGSITRREADELLFPKLPDLLNDKQKKNKVSRILLIVLKGRIKNVGVHSKPQYVMFNCDDKKDD